MKSESLKMYNKERNTIAEIKLLMEMGDDKFYEVVFADMSKQEIKQEYYSNTTLKKDYD